MLIKLPEIPGTFSTFRAGFVAMRYCMQHNLQMVHKILVAFGRQGISMNDVNDYKGLCFFKMIWVIGAPVYHCE